MHIPIDRGEGSFEWKESALHSGEQGSWREKRACLVITMQAFKIFQIGTDSSF